MPCYLTIVETKSVCAGCGVALAPCHPGALPGCHLLPGPKENLVLRCRQWPGLQCIDALTEGKPLEGFWQDRSLEYEAKRRGKELDPETFITRYTLKLDPLPCWRHLAEEQIRRHIREIVADVDAQAARRVVLNGVSLPSAEAIRKQDPHKIPEYTKTSPAPAVHAASKAVRKQMKEAYRLFVEAYREAAVSLRAGNLNAKFPPGCRPSHSFRRMPACPVAEPGQPARLASKRQR